MSKKLSQSLEPQAAREAAVSFMAVSGISQAAVARISGVSRATVSQFLRGIYPGDNVAVARKVSCAIASADIGPGVATDVRYGVRLHSGRYVKSLAETVACLQGVLLAATKQKPLAHKERSGIEDRIRATIALMQHVVEYTKGS